MLWPALVLALIAALLAGFGWREMDCPGPADERLDGGFLILGAIVAFVLAVLWWIAVVTWKAFA